MLKTLGVFQNIPQLNCWSHPCWRGSKAHTAKAWTQLGQIMEIWWRRWNHTRKQGKSPLWREIQTCQSNISKVILTFQINQMQFVTQPGKRLPTGGKITWPSERLREASDTWKHCHLVSKRSVMFFFLRSLDVIFREHSTSIGKTHVVTGSAPTVGSLKGGAKGFPVRDTCGLFTGYTKDWRPAIYMPLLLVNMSRCITCVTQTHRNQILSDDNSRGLWQDLWQWDMVRKY